MSITHPDDIQEDLENVVLLTKGEINGFTMQKRYFHKNGSTIFINMVVAPIYSGHKETRQHLAMINDISRLKKAEEEKAVLQEKLNHKSKMDSFGQIAGGIAHDFNNILNGIFSAAQLLKIKNKDIEKSSMKYIDLIEKSADRASDLTNKLLLFSRKKKIEKTTFDIRNLLNDTIEILRSTIDKKIRISMENDNTDSIIYPMNYNFV